MVGNEEDKRSSLTNGLVRNIVKTTLDFIANITELDLSNGKISSFDKGVELPPNVVYLNISNNKLTDVPPSVLNLENLKTLDLSYNSIVFFDDTPCFCHTIEWLNLSYNTLNGPPFWVWAEKPKKLAYLNLSNNKDICESFKDGYFEELLAHKTLVSEINLHNCKLSKYIKLLSTFCDAKVVSLGSRNYDYYSYLNHLDHVPCAGLEDCCDIEKLNLSNTQLYHVNSNIDIYKNLKEINLAQNNLNSLPNEFSNLENLEICVLSCNKLLYLPDELYKLTKLVGLYLDNNELCMLPERLHEISSLRMLDLYNNNLYEGLDKINNLEEVDFAQNYFEEPNETEYLIKKEKLRLNCSDRENGNKAEVIREDSVHSTDGSDDEELYALIHNAQDMEVNNQERPSSTRSSSPEDWDSDEYWIPQYYKPETPPRSPWLIFVKRKMAEGNFCPMDAHPVSIADKVKYEKLCHPTVEIEFEGQFDDYSSDDS